MNPTYYEITTFSLLVKIKYIYFKDVLTFNFNK